MRGSESVADRELALGPVASRVYQTSAGLLYATFSVVSVLLAKVPADGWFPILGPDPRAARSSRELARALRQRGLADREATQLAEQLLIDWQAIEIPEERTRRQQLADLVRMTILLLGLVGRMPRFMWEVMRGRNDPSEPQADFVHPGSPEYGVIRLVRTSRGWAVFEYWGGPRATLGIQRDDGWLPLNTFRHYLEQTAAVDALHARGIPTDEAERLYTLVTKERQVRVALSVAG